MDGAELNQVARFELTGLAGQDPLAVDEGAAGRFQVADRQAGGRGFDQGMPRFHRSGRGWVLLRAEVNLADDELGAVEWEWQSADGAMGKARFGGDHVGPNPTDRGKNGVKRSVIVDQDGGPLGAVIAGANVHDTKLLASTIEAIVVDRPEPTAESPQHLCLDKAYDNPTGREAAAAKGHTPHIRRIGEEKVVRRGKKNTSHAGG